MAFLAQKGRSLIPTSHRTSDRPRLGKFLLRRERYFPGRDRAWTAVHRDWLASLVFDDLPSEATFAERVSDLLCVRPR